jgi:hypothetical protein
MKQEIQNDKLELPKVQLVFMFRPKVGKNY